jgi:16S rRNA (guanine527-N7)-methyltransferase
LPTEPLAAAVPRVIDLGSGAGFPALPLKIWNPGIGLVLVESNHKKVAFLREVTRALTLTNVDIISERAESLLPSLGPAFPPADVVTFRAVERFNQILPTATALLSSAPGSRLAVLVGSAQLSSTTALPNLGWTTFPLPNAGSRVLSIGVRQ